MEFFKKSLPGFVLCFLAVVACLIATTHATEPAHPWLVTGVQPTLKQLKVVGPTEIPPTVGGQGNVGCKNETVITRPAKPLIGGQQTTTACFVETLFGHANGNGLIRFNNTTTAGTFVSSASYKPGFIAIPNSPDIISYTTEPVNGLYLHFTRNLPARVSVETSLLGDITYRMNGVADASLRDKAGHLLAAQTDSLSFSSSGDWLVVDSPPYSLLRVNTKTLDVLPFANLFNYNIGLAPLPKTAVSSNGRYAAVASFDFTQFRLYDLSTCDTNVPTTITGPVGNCQFFDAYMFLKQQIPGFLGVSNIRFLSDDTITFIAGYKNAQNVNERASYSLSAPGTQITQLQYLGMGDSFASGEGAFAYQDGTDTDNNKCHLSLRSYPNLIKADLGFDSAHSVACSGTKIDDIVNPTDDYRGRVKDGLTKLERGLETLQSYKDNFTPGFLAQHEFTDTYQPGIITISTIGNDIGFADKIKRCLEPDTCFSSYEDRLEIVKEINNKFDDVTGMYQKLKDPNPNARIYAIGYPQIAEVGGDCGNNVHFSAQELDFAHQLIDYLNFVVKRAADNVGVRCVDVSNAFSGQMLCDPVNNLAVNGITAGNDAPDILNVSVIGNESYHPNEKGQELLKQRILNQTQNLTQAMPTKPDASATKPDDNPDITFLNIAHTGRQVYQQNYDEDLSNNVIVRGGAWSFTVDGLKLGIKAQAQLHALIHSDPISLGDLTADTNGNITGNLTIPTNTPVGFHTLHLQGNNIAGEPIDLYKTIYVAAGQDDLDGDGTPNTTDPCTGVESSGQDVDVDGIDDACDGEIGEPPTPPSASFLTPIANSTLGGTTQISINTQDQRGIAGVTFKLDGHYLDNEDTTEPYSYDLGTTSFTNGEHVLSATVRNTVGLTTTIKENITIYNNLPPIVSVTAPPENTTVGGTVQIVADASDNKAVQSVQFEVDGQNIGSQLSTPPYSYDWDTSTVANGSHTITATAIDDEGLSTSTTIMIKVYNLPPPPTVTITAPAPSATLSGTVVITADAQDTEGIEGVQFKIDGNNAGPEQTTPPLTYSWDTKAVNNGQHTISATARSINEQTKTTSLIVTVQNQTPPPTTNPIIKLIKVIVAVVIKVITSILKLFR